MMKAAEASDSLRAPAAKLAYSLPCSARDLPTISDKKVDRGGESLTTCPVGTASKLPSSHAVADIDMKVPPLSGTPSHDADVNAGSGRRRNQVLTNLMQTGGVKSRCSPQLASAGSMERRRRCSCGEPNYLSSNNVVPNGSNCRSNYSSCNCNVENCAWEEGLSAPAAPPLKAHPWRSSSDQSNTNAALLRALAAMKKVSGEPDAVKKAPPKPPPSRNATDIHLRSSDELDMNARSITNSDARTLSMRERGRWGNSKMQQQLFTQPGCGATAAGVGGQNVKANMSSEHQHPQHHHHQQPLQHVQCLHCGSFSTTPVSGVAQGARSHSFGRKVRDYSWQQELLQEQKRPEQQGSKEATPIGDGQAQSGPQGAHNDAILHHRCEYAHVADMLPEYEQGPAALMKVPHMHGGNAMSWQERYMLLCQAIAAGAFVDSCMDDMSGPVPPASRGYSWAVCECAACEMGCATAAAGFHPGCPAGAGYCNTSSGERMMELEAFSGPLGYVSESKAGAELSSILEKRPPAAARRRWWARLPSFGRSKNSSCPVAAAGRAASGQNTAQCCSCGQRVWTRGNEEEELGGRLCPDCIVRAAGNKCESGPIPGPTTAQQPTPPRAARPRPPPPFSSHHKHLPRRWRLMKLCRYLMGFPLQR